MAYRSRKTANGPANSKTTKQQNHQTTRQQNHQTTKQQNHQTTKHLLISDNLPPQQLNRVC